MIERTWFILLLLFHVSIRSNAGFWNVYDETNDNPRIVQEMQQLFSNKTIEYGVDVVRTCRMILEGLLYISLQTFHNFICSTTWKSLSFQLFMTVISNAPQIRIDELPMVTA
jgi:hypothetical protein